MTTLFSRALFAAGAHLVRTVADRQPVVCRCTTTYDSGPASACTVCGSTVGEGTTYRCLGVEDGYRCQERVREDDLLCLACEVDEAAQASGAQTLAEAT